MASEEPADTEDGGVESSIEAEAASKARALLTQMLSIVEKFRQEQVRFEERLWDRWKPAFDLYDLVLYMVRHVAGYFDSHYRSEAVQNRDALFEVLTRLHGRAYRTAREIRSLLVAGEPDGAIARWRTMHELLVVMLFIEKHGASVAQRYLDYDAVQRWLNMQEYKRNYAKWGLQPLDAGEEQLCKDEYDQVIARYGKDFKGSYGWAAGVVRQTWPKLSHITIAALEQDINLEHRRLYYGVASNGIHPNVKGLGSDLGLEFSPSMRQLGIAGVSALADLADCTYVVLHLRESHDTQVAAAEIGEIVNEAARVFLESQQKLEGDEIGRVDKG